MWWESVWGGREILAVVWRQKDDIKIEMLMPGKRIKSLNNLLEVETPLVKPLGNRKKKKKAKKK